MKELHRIFRLLYNGLVSFLKTYFLNSIYNYRYFMLFSFETSFKPFPNIDSLILIIAYLNFKNYWAPFRWYFDEFLSTLRHLINESS